MLKNLAMAVVRKVSQIGVKEEDNADVRMSIAIQNVVVLFGAVPVQLIQSYLYFSFGETRAALILLAFVLTSIAVIALFGVLKKYHSVFHGVTLLNAFCGVPCTLVLGGLAGSSYMIVWGLAAPLIALAVFGRRMAVFWFLVFVGLVVSCVLAQPYLITENRVPDLWKVLLTCFNLIGVGGMAVGTLMFFSYQRDAAYHLLDLERGRAEGLLLNILPKEIAEFLKHEPQVFADHFDEASVLFADVVDFTSMSSDMSPMEMVKVLNEVFSYFDTLAEKYGLEKIKTIGDCYMVAAGIPTKRADHAIAMALMAVEMRDYVARNHFYGKKIKFRIGINSGPVVAGVIGRKKFIYDLWGDAVNLASRMESQGQPGTIQITTGTYDLIKDDFVCEPRAPVTVKGKGELQIWHVMGSKGAGRRAQPSLSARLGLARLLH